MRIIKKIVLGFFIFLGVLLIAAIVLPIAFKGKIKQMVDAEIAKSVDADVVFDVNNFSLSVFRHFPNMTVEIKELGVFNHAPFAGEHLFVVDKMEVEVNLKDILFGDQLRVKAITVVKPQINVKVLKDGRANYNIAKPSTDTVKKADEPSVFSFAIDKWTIENGEVVYDDASMPFLLALRGLNHTGNGNFNEKEFDLTTHTTADSVTVAYGGTEYISRKHAQVDAVIAISENYTKYTFKQNAAKLNDFALGFDGWFKMNEKDFGMDITFKSPDNSFKSILSLVPGMYASNFNNVQTKGELAFDGYVKGTYSDKQLPAFQLTLNVKEAEFKYPSLPTAVNNIAVDLLVRNTTGVMQDTYVDLKKFHIDFGSNPVDAHATIENLRDYKTDAFVKARINFAEMSKMFPMEGMTLTGLLDGAVSAKGVYDAVKKIPVSGNVILKDFKFTSKSLPYATAISKLDAVFDPSKIDLKTMDATVGKSDFHVTGQVKNYMDYVFAKGTIAGAVNLQSTLIDLNEFMTSSTTPEKKDTSKLSVIPVPQNIDFLFHSDIKAVNLMDYRLTDAVGDIVVKDGIAKLNGVKFHMLGGAFAVNGTYNTKDLQHPAYDFALKIEDLSIQQAANSFSIIKTYAPIAGLAQGKFGTDFSIAGELQQNMMPKLNTINGAGLIKIAEAAVTQSKLVSGITSLTNLKDADQVTLKNVLMSAEIKDGKLQVKPFNVKIGNYATTVSGATSLDGGINYALKMNVPAGKLGSQLSSLVGGSANATTEIPVNIGLGGTFTNPKFQLASQEQKQQVKEAVTNAAKDKAKEALQQAAAGTKAQDLVNSVLGGKKDTTKSKTDSTKANPVQDALQNKLQNLLKRKKKN